MSCRKAGKPCRQPKVDSLDRTPAREPRGSIRARRRAEMRKQKVLAMQKLHDGGV